MPALTYAKLMPTIELHDNKYYREIPVIIGT